jgi:uncharacterized protein YbbC (DUF1343 family)
VSEGRGTEFPFKSIAAPYFTKALDDFFIRENINFRFDSVRPVTIAGKAVNPKYEEQKIAAYNLRLKNLKLINGPELGLRFLKEVQKLYPEDFKITSTDFLNKLTGVQNCAEYLKSDSLFLVLMNKVKTDLENYSQLRQKYLIYD